MRYLILISFLTAISATGYCQHAVDSALYQYAKASPAHTKIRDLVRYLKKGSKNNSETVELFFYWIALNIQYDRPLSNNSDRTATDIALDSVLLKKKTICAGYSNLFYELCKQANIECVVVEGICRNYIPNKSEGHAWNAVKINGRWKLFDTTWGSGGFGMGSDEYTPQMDTRYLFGEPDFFIIDHLPNEPRWQLLARPITLKQFNNADWNEKRFRKFNNLLDEEEYKSHLQMMKNNGWDQ